MSKKQKIEVGLIIVIMIFLVVFLAYYLFDTIHMYVKRVNNSSQIVEKVNEIYDKEGYQIILFASPTCSVCKKFVPILDEVVKENNLEYYYLDASSLLKEDLEKILMKINIDLNGVPHLAIINNKKIVIDKSGFQEKEKIIELFKQAGLLEGNNENE